MPLRRLHHLGNPGRNELKMLELEPRPGFEPGPFGFLEPFPEALTRPTLYPLSYRGLPLLHPGAEIFVFLS